MLATGASPTTVVEGSRRHWFIHDKDVPVSPRQQHLAPHRGASCSERPSSTDDSQSLNATGGNPTGKLSWGHDSDSEDSDAGLSLPLDSELSNEAECGALWGERFVGSCDSRAEVCSSGWAALLTRQVSLESQGGLNRQATGDDDELAPWEVLGGETTQSPRASIDDSRPPTFESSLGDEATASREQAIAAASSAARATE